MKKKIMTVLLLTGLMACMTACGNSTAEMTEQGDTQEIIVDEQAGAGEEQAETENTVSEQAEETQEPTAEPTPTATALEIDENSGILLPDVQIAKENIPDTDAMAFVHDMKVGWNLGNTLDANNDGTPSNELSTETCWGNPTTTKEMIDAIKAAGYNTLRLPVTWHGHVTIEPTAESHMGAGITVSDVWMDRVQEVVDYARDNGMYVILNIHHDTNQAYYYPDSAHYDQSANFMAAVWTAICERFKDYDNHLIFESINEPRLVGTNVEWNFSQGDKSCQDSEDCINRLNQLFVDIVRASGGNNAERYLMVPGYSASLAGVATDLFVLPKDTADNKIIVSVHAYTPYNFALNPSGYDKFDVTSSANTGEIDTLMTTLFNKFISNGTPVVIGEYGAIDRNGNLQDRVNYHTYFIAAARARGISCCVWDNGFIESGNELFGLFDRQQMKWEYPEIVAAMMKYS